MTQINVWHSTQMVASFNRLETILPAGIQYEKTCFLEGTRDSHCYATLSCSNRIDPFRIHSSTVPVNCTCKQSATLFPLSSNPKESIHWLTHRLRKISFARRSTLIWQHFSEKGVKSPRSTRVSPEPSRKSTALSPI